MNRRIERITEAVSRSIDEVNRNLPREQQLSKNGASTILGQNAVLDSLGFLGLLVVVEREVEAEFGTELRLTEDETIMDDSRIQTVETLIQHIVNSFEE